MTPSAYRSEAGVVSVGSTSVAATGFGATAARAADREIRRTRRVAELGMLGRLEVAGSRRRVGARVGNAGKRRRDRGEEHECEDNGTLHLVSLLSSLISHLL